MVRERPKEEEGRVLLKRYRAKGEEHRALVRRAENEKRSAVAM